LLHGKQVGLFHRIISKDGMTIKGTAKITDAQGKPFEPANVFEKLQGWVRRRPKSEPTGEIYPCFYIRFCRRALPRVSDNARYAVFVASMTAIPPGFGAICCNIWISA
jgi:hypothetical protein